MTVNQLNEFRLFGKEYSKKKSFPKVTWKIKNSSVHFNFAEFKKAYIFKYDEDYGSLKNKFGQYHIFGAGKSHTFKGDYKTLSAAIEAFISETNILISNAKTGKTETSPADLPKLKITDFDLKKLEKDLT